MQRELRILLLEDTVIDAKVIEHELQKAKLNFHSERVETEDAFLEALERFAPDVILSDFSLAGDFNGLVALRLLKARRPDIPFLLVTGSQPEEVAIECIKEGLDDYILKANLKRLPSAVLSALRNKETERERERTKAALDRTEEQYRLIAENTHDLICLLDQEGNFLYASPSFREVLGYDPEALIGSDSFSLIYAEDREAVAKAFRDSRLNRQRLVTEFRYRRRTGEWRTLESVGSWIVDPAGNPPTAVMVSRDVTEHRRLETQFRQAQKMEAVGRLAGGVAHDFNNMLTVITGYGEILLQRLAKDDPSRGFVEEITHAAQRAAGLTRQLLAFSRQQVLTSVELGLNTVVTNMDKMLRRLIGEHINLVTVLGNDLAKVKADECQIGQVILNLVVNARDAMPDGGTLMLETANVELDESYARRHIAVRPGPYVMLAVSDTGCGMDAETQSHIFEPFFTTKEEGKGTGLGLATVYGIVQQSNGNIWVYSEPGHGTTFKIYLPSISGPEAVAERSVKLPAIPRGTETILLVEDEGAVRALARRVLQMHGYRVIEAKNGEEAIQLANQHTAPIEMIVTDMIMPGMSGAELARRLAPVRPDMKVLFLSGYTDNAILHQGVADERMAFLQKPFTPEALARKVREILGEPRCLDQ